MNVAQLLVKCLENEGVRHVFGIPGEETLALNAALAESDKITFVLTRHEQGAAVTVASTVNANDCRSSTLA